MFLSQIDPDTLDPMRWWETLQLMWGHPIFWVGIGLLVLWILAWAWSRKRKSDGN